MAETTPIPSIPSPPFQYTFEEYEELHIILDRRRHRLASPRRHRSEINSAPNPLRNVRYIFIAVLAAGMFALIKFGDELPGFLAERPGEDLVVKVFGPIFLVVISLSILGRIRRRAKLHGRRFTETAAEKTSMSFAVLYPVLGLVYLAVAVLRSKQTGTTATLLHDLTMVIVPWTFLFLTFLLLGARTRARAASVLRKTWEDSPHLHCKKRVEISMQSFRLTDFQARFELDWERFKSEEGENLFVLIAGGIFFMVPKRVLSMEQIEFIRDRLGLRQADQRTGGFPALPAKPG
jgi:hypothetical protein